MGSPCKNFGAYIEYGLLTNNHTQQRQANRLLSSIRSVRGACAYVGLSDPLFLALKEWLHNCLAYLGGNTIVKRTDHVKDHVRKQESETYIGYAEIVTYLNAAVRTAASSNSAERVEV